MVLLVRLRILHRASTVDSSSARKPPKIDRNLLVNLFGESNADEKVSHAPEAYWEAMADLYYWQCHLSSDKSMETIEYGIETKTLPIIIGPEGKKYPHPREASLDVVSTLHSCCNFQNS